MKQKIYILGLAAALIINIGIVFKVNHWPAAGILLTLGILMLVFVFLPVALRNHYRVEGSNQNLILYIVTWLTCFIVFMGMLFKIMHWPHAGLALLIALPFPYLVFLPVFLVVTSKNKKFNIYNTVLVLFLLATVSALSLLLALSVSKERIADSLVLAGNYNRMENALSKIPSENKRSTMNQKIVDLLKIAGEYRNLILDCDNIIPDEWKSDPEVLLTSEKWQLQSNVIMERGESLYTNLKKGLSDLIILLEETPGYENLAKAAPAIFDMGLLNGRSYTFNSDLIITSQQPWSVIYLDGLETNLVFIRASL